MRIGLLLVVVACGDNAAPPAQVHDGFLHDALGRARIMRGVNLSGSHKYAPYLDDKTPADYTRLRADWGFNAARFVMTWAAVEPQPGVYDDAYLDRVAERLAWADAAGITVVLDMHQDIYGEGFGFDGAPRWTCDEARYAAFEPKEPWFVNATDPNVVACVDGFYERPELRAAFAAAWRHVAERLHDQPAVVGFDVLNEPNWGSYPLFAFERERLGPFYAEVVPPVREVAPHWVAFLEPSASRNGGISTTLEVAAFADVMYAPHSYDTMAESGGGFDPARRQLIVDNVADLAREANLLEAGLWIGEYGGVATNPGIVEYMTAQYDAAGAVAASTMYWAYDKGDGYSLLDADGNEKPVLLGALVRPYPERVAGTPIAYGFDAGVFTVTYTPDRGITAPTLIAVPARVYPSGFTVDCGDCTYEITAGQLAITQPPSGSTATITVRP
ncbi:MAG: cellulase family glycosylhydrolase [Kofleriaceae bacterium]